MDLRTAVQIHTDWKIRFRATIQKQERIDSLAIGREDCCEFGTWLNGEGKAHFGSLPHFGACATAHVLFHQEAGKVAAAINGRNYAGAEAMLALGSSYSSASNGVTQAIMRLFKEIGS